MAREPPHKMSAANKRLASFAHRQHEPLTHPALERLRSDPAAAVLELDRSSGLNRGELSPAVNSSCFVRFARREVPPSAGDA